MRFTEISFVKNRHAKKIHWLICFSPSVFKTTAPKQTDDARFKWTIEEISNLKPADIDETTVELFDSAESDPQHEVMAQARIERFFSEKHIIPSPFSAAIKPVELLKMQSPPSPVAVQTVEGNLQNAIKQV